MGGRLPEDKANKTLAAARCLQAPRCFSFISLLYLLFIIHLWIQLDLAQKLNTRARRNGDCNGISLHTFSLLLRLRGRSSLAQLISGHNQCLLH